MPLPDVTSSPPAPVGALVSRRRMIPVALLTAALLTGALAACSSKEKPPACPRVAVLNGAGTLTRFAPGGGRDILDMDFEAEIADVVSACRDQKRDGNPISVVVVAPVLVANRGPANQDRQARFNYFVSVVDGSETILTKQIFPIAMDFSGSRNRVVLRDDDPPITIDVPNPQKIGARGYEILVGFQLTQEEIDYNRKRAASGDVGGALIQPPGSVQ
ncbi:MAG: hypothetical protein U1E42_02095 [Rhodospirillales bacterium]